jgi:hypothetical protein
MSAHHRLSLDRPPLRQLAVYTLTVTDTGRFYMSPANHYGTVLRDNPYTLPRHYCRAGTECRTVLNVTARHEFAAPSNRNRTSL